MQKSLVQIFHDEAKAMHDAFPEKLENLVVLLLSSSDAKIYAAPEIMGLLRNNIAEVKMAVRERTDYLCAYKATAVSSPDYPLAGTTVKMIALNENPPSIYLPRYTKEMEITANLRHELGHYVIKKGRPFDIDSRKHLAESAANAYAALLHVKQFGKETDFFEWYGNRASTMVLGGDWVHYTNDVFERVKQFTEETDISGLSLRETAKLAEKIAIECRLNKKTLEKISTAFLPAKDAYEKSKELNDAVLRKCIEVMREHKDDSDIFKAGKRFFSQPDIKEHLEHSAETDTYWKDALDFIKNHRTKPVVKRSTPALQTPS
ncbi:MAG: hypothetical protein V1721_08220 [Pseudomonadota bacterium]